MNQVQARNRAKELNEEFKGKHTFVAAAVPLISWGGNERGWAVYHVTQSDMKRASIMYHWWEGTE